MFVKLFCRKSIRIFRNYPDRALDGFHAVVRGGDDGKSGSFCIDRTVRADFYNRRIARNERSFDFAVEISHKSGQIYFFVRYGEERSIAQLDESGRFIAVFGREIRFGFVISYIIDINHVVGLCYAELYRNGRIAFHIQFFQQFSVFYAHRNPLSRFEDMQKLTVGNKRKPVEFFKIGFADNHVRFRFSVVYGKIQLFGIFDI